MPGTSGVVDHFAQNDAHALAICRRIVGTLTGTGVRMWRCETRRRRSTIRPNFTNSCRPTSAQPYDMREVIARIVDGSEFDEFKRLYGTTLICGFAHFFGYPAGILANDGILFCESP